MHFFAKLAAVAAAMPLLALADETSTTTVVLSSCHTSFAKGTNSLAVVPSTTSSHMHTRTLVPLRVTSVPTSTVTVTTSVSTAVTFTETDSTSTTVTETPTAYVMPTYAGEVPIESGVLGASAMGKRSEHFLEKRVAPATPQQLMMVGSTASIKGYHPASITCHETTRTRYYVTHTKTASHTVTSTYTSSVTNELDATTTTITTTTTYTETAPTPTVYSACDASQGYQIGSVGGYDIDQVTVYMPAGNGIFAQYTDSAYDCCASCQNDPACAVSGFVPDNNQCYFADSYSSNPADPRSRVTYSNSERLTGNNGLIVSNGPRGNAEYIVVSDE